ncbi:MAG: DegQ family serine endoprotease [Desulfuromonas sp.]|nr:DegQ family serine endoprotease [Desulfuromonas sp.]
MKRFAHAICIVCSLLMLPALCWSSMPDFVALTKQLKPAVVNISSSKKANSSGGTFDRLRSPHQDFFEDFFEKFFQGREIPQHKQKSLGSGFIISADGYILTNDHVVDNADKITVQLAGGKTFSASLEGIDPKLDLALLKIDTEEKLPTVKLGNSDSLEIGEWVMAIGNPFGLQQTVTVGIVSAKGRVIGAGPYDNFIQTDASINPGNSGGPLFNTRGEVVGINTAIVAGGQGIGFAIPINAAKSILPQLKETGHVTRGWLGVTIQQVSEDLANSFGLHDATGALISAIAKDSPAARAGLKRGDVILRLNDQKIESMNDLPRLVADIPVGEKAQVTIFRQGEEKIFAVEIGKLEDTVTRETTMTQRTPLGLTTMEISPELRRRLNIQAEQGVVITSIEPDSPAAAATLRPGDVIVEFNNQEILSNADLEKAMAATEGNAILRLLIQRGKGLFFIAIKQGE